MAGALWEPDFIDVMVDLIDNANASIDLAVMGFTHEPLIDAFIRAYDRGVKVRMVGDAGSPRAGMRAASQPGART